MIAALFVQTDGVYFNLEGVDPWDVHRDARKYAGPHPVVAHPPCERWSKFAHIHKHKPGKGLGQDEGCFEKALEAVERWGGVLEHPVGSAAWKHYGIPDPPAEGWQRCIRGGWTCQVEQGHYGHRAPKGTWLYYVGKRAPPSLRWGPSGATHRIELMFGLGPERSRTPLAFRNMLLELADFSTSSPPK
jgi:hypothetical protein